MKVRLTEGQLRELIKETIYEVMNEGEGLDYMFYSLNKGLEGKKHAPGFDKHSVSVDNDFEADPKTFIRYGSHRGNGYYNMETGHHTTNSWGCPEECGTIDRSWGGAARRAIAWPLGQGLYQLGKGIHHFTKK